LVNTLLAFLFVLGVLVFVHEFGHYMMAKRLGIKVLTFSLGFGPKLLKYRWGDTEYCISAVPLGGYVKMAGENPDDPRTGRDDEFLSRNKWQRFQVLIMGPAMNLVLAVVLMAIVLMQGAQIPAFVDAPVVVGAVTAGSPAERAGIQPGDRITKVGSRTVNTWEEFSLIIGTRAKREVPVTFLRQGREMQVQVVPTSETRLEMGDIGVLPNVHPRIAAMQKDGPATRAGLSVGDLIRAVNGQTIIFARDLSDVVKKYKGVATPIEIERGGKALTVSVVPESRPELGGGTGIGISIEDALKIIQPGPLQAIGMSFQKNVQFAGLIFQTVWGLITRETSPRQLMGPVAIAQLSGEYAAAGWVALLTLMASISLNLGLINLLPIPVLDGGHIFIMAVEGLARRDFSMRVKEKMLLAGFVLLVMLMVTVIYNDLTRIPWIEGLMPWRR
jgi:regulator of sigma E protease